MKETDFSAAVGRRVLARRWVSSMLFEAQVLEISPSGERAKLRYESGSESWLLIEDYVLVEVLPDKRREPR